MQIHDRFQNAATDSHQQTPRGSPVLGDIAIIKELSEGKRGSPAHTQWSELIEEVIIAISKCWKSSDFRTRFVTMFLELVCLSGEQEEQDSSQTQSHQNFYRVQDQSEVRVHVWLNTKRTANVYRRPSVSRSSLRLYLTTAVLQSHSINIVKTTAVLRELLSPISSVTGWLVWANATSSKIFPGVLNGTFSFKKLPNISCVHTQQWCCVGFQIKCGKEYFCWW